MTHRVINRRIKMRHLICFLEVVRQGGVSRAGIQLDLTQSAVSKAVAELEELLGVALFDRSGRSFMPTRYGHMFLQYAQAAASALRQGIDSVSGAALDAAIIRLGALPTVEAEIVPLAVARFMDEHATVRVAVESGPSPHLLQLLRDGTLDFIVGRVAPPDAMHGLVFEHLYSESLVAVVRPHHPLANVRRLSFVNLQPYPILMPPSGAIIRPFVDTLLVAGGMGRVARSIETVSNSFARAFTLATDAVWLISDSVVVMDLLANQLSALDLDAHSGHGPVGITTRAEADLSVGARALIAHVRQVALERT